MVKRVYLTAYKINETNKNLWQEKWLKPLKFRFIQHDFAEYTGRKARSFLSFDARKIKEGQLQTER